ncbi:hypothetical protein [Polaribacter cellanae]|uniref:Lipoprotein n=1 Tax=Polaribacter cellanae TaxID=2818493 RepID=A0A975H582_9FLAO|nr:hypothetical protein [Polaribacter cellanae]QTE21136.1 hypothetical protein J3359_09760 [Polaribacter cellanae]
MVNKWLFYALCIVFLFSCNQKKKGIISSELFNTENLNQEIKSVNDLKSQGFNPMEGNILLLEKVNKDIIVHLQVDPDFNDLRCKIWSIKIKSIDIEFVSDFLLKYDLHMISSRCYSYTENSTCQFSVFNPKNNKVYICEVFVEDDTPTLKVIYFIPR